MFVTPRCWTVLPWGAFSLVVALTAAGCEDAPTPQLPTDGGVDAPNTCPFDAPALCDGDRLVQCLPDGASSVRDCTLEGLRCADGLGCTKCVPGSLECRDGVQPLQCRADGSGFDEVAVCDTAAGSVCSEGRGCIASAELCQAAADDSSYIGCEYWPTVTLNNLLGVVDSAAPPDIAEFRFAVAVGNPQPVPALITITRGGTPVTTTTIAPSSTETIELDWVESLRNPRRAGSAFVRGGAYKLTSSVPVTAFQFNALQFRIESDPPRFSYSNDASLLFPTQALRCAPRTPCRFVAVTASALPVSPSFVSVTATGAVDINVMVRPSVAVRASTEDDEIVRVPTLAAQETATFVLRPGDVLSLAAASGDMTGTSVVVDGPASVISGNGCANVPGNTVTACDHVEESIPPVSAWGTRYLVRRTRPAINEPNQLRIVAAFDGTEVMYGPGRAPDLLQAGEFVSFPLRADTIAISANKPILVAQFLVGQSYSELAGQPPAPYGDPSMSIVAPAVQFRRNYVFLTPASYDRNAVAIVARAGASIVLDGVDVALTSSEGLASTDVSLAAGFHVIRGDQPFGIQVYSLADYTSYMYPGGLNLSEVVFLE